MVEMLKPPVLRLIWYVSVFIVAIYQINEQTRVALNFLVYDLGFYGLTTMSLIAGLAIVLTIQKYRNKI